MSGEHWELLIMLLISCPPSSPPKYLGHVEVEESRGMHVCEDAVKKLKAVSDGLEPGRGNVIWAEAALTGPLRLHPHPRWAGSQ